MCLLDIHILNVCDRVKKPGTGADVIVFLIMWICLRARIHLCTKRCRLHLHVHIVNVCARVKKPATGASVGPRYEI